MKYYLIGLFLLLSSNLFSQKILSVAPVAKQNNSYWFTFKDNEQISVQNFFSEYSYKLGLNENDHFIYLKSNTDTLGISHYQYYQTYKGIIVEGGDFLLHEKNGRLIKSNGHFYNDLNININPTITDDSALNIIKNSIIEKFYIVDTNDNILQSSMAKIVIAPINGNYITNNFRLCYKFNIITKKPYSNYNIYLDAHTGEFVNMISNICDVNAFAHTVYSGSQIISTEYYNNSYRLHDISRNIKTYNSTDIDINTFPNCPDFTDTDNYWTGNFILKQIKISYANINYWYTSFTDEVPDLYIKIYDGSYNNVYKSVYYSNTNPSVSFNLNIPLTNPPYTFEIWDYDNVGSDDYGGSYNIVINNGINNFSDNNNFGTFTIEEDNLNPALDAHWGLEKTYDFYLNKMKRKSFNGAGGEIVSYVNPNKIDINGFPNNSCALTPISNGDTINLIFWGIGNGDYMDPVVSLDVVAHEFTHLVTNHSVQSKGDIGLYYQNESGALNESFSDIFATAVEFYTKPLTANWTIGEDVIIPFPFMRSLSDPSSASLVLTLNDTTIDLRQPKKYLDPFWHPLIPNTFPNQPPNDSIDHGGVHYNCGVQNHWFYLVSQGGDGVTGIGIEQATQIAYRNLTTYLSPNSDYFDSYKGSLSSAEDLFGLCSKQFIAVQNAWQAVGVGEGIITPPPTVNNINLCQNDSAIALNVNGDKIKWYSCATDCSGDTIAPIPNTSIVGITSYWVTQTSTSKYFCESPRAKIDVIVNSIPTKPSVFSPIYYCQNAISTPLSASGSNLKWYNELIGGISSSISPIPLTKKVDTINFYVTQTIKNCESPKTKIVVIVKELPVTPIIIQNGNNFISNYPSGNQWFYNSSLIQDGINQTYTPKQDGYYYVIVTQNGCKSDTSNVLSNFSVGVNNNYFETNYNIYPNPSKSIITIVNSNQKILNIKIIDILGNTLFTSDSHIYPSESSNINISSFPNGVYYIILNTESNIYQRKIVKQ